MIPEAIFAILACSKIGAVHNTIFSGFSSGAIATRLYDLETKILLTCNEIERRGNKINLQDNWSFALEQNKLSKIIVVDQCSVGFPIPGFDTSVFDDLGNETTNGYLVIKKPWPSMTRGLPNGSDKFIENYWSRYKTYGPMVT
jgi:acyl-coenzyme A synthetase/AMP-(fatty) acid ligase